jgi:hypothetical protein
MIRELLAVLWDAVLHGDLRGHLRAWRQVAGGEVGPDTRVWASNPR